GRFKEIRLKPNIDEHDFATKVKQVQSFLKKKDKVKVNLFFRGRQMEHLDLGRKVLDKFIVDTQGDGQVEKPPALEGRIMSFVIATK
ncbi:MAG: translation initiation factor IF-3, partial [Candidatus Omnitrophica bacterium]|nr:translation initiation factor IF-3 [Candidatus Omnitrophota bacterium]